MKQDMITPRVLAAFLSRFISIFALFFMALLISEGIDIMELFSESEPSSLFDSFWLFVLVSSSLLVLFIDFIK